MPRKATQKVPHAFGRAMLEHWWLDPAIAYLNHGTVGATPRRVLQAQQQLREEIERQPARFMLRELMSLSPDRPAADGDVPRLRRAADAVAAHLGARGDDIVFVDNASSGFNAVLRSLPLKAGDEILVFDHAYGALARTARFVARGSGAQVVEAPLPWPMRDEASCLEALSRHLTPRTRIAVLDHVTSETALVLPLKAMAALCRERGVPVLADGAHAPGALALDIASLGVDWYTANLHKWAFAPRGCGVLWVAPERREGLHPTIISWGLDQGLHQQFDWTGTRDPTAWLCAPAGFRFMSEVLGEEAMRDYNHALAWHAAQRVSDAFAQAFPTPRAMVGSMVSIPLPAAFGSEPADAARLQNWLLFEQQIEAPVALRSGRLSIRVSAQVYNDEADIERLVQALQRYAPA